MTRTVTADLELDVTAEVDLVLEVAVADTALLVEEELTVRTADGPVDPREVDLDGDGRAHLLTAPVGRVTVAYRAVTTGRSAPAVVTPADELVYLRPSRYAESDELAAVAAAEFAGLEDPTELLPAVSSWVGRHLAYVPGSSRPTDGAVATMLQRSGVCRDYAHLVVALLRAKDVPARLVAVYAPGLDPMDFHAVAEAAIDGRWAAVDATLLAPRESLLRISTGRDAADTAFLSTYRGTVELTSVVVSATTDGDLPRDDVRDVVHLG